jgi:hypothetical protein
MTRPSADADGQLPTGATARAGRAEATATAAPAPSVAPATWTPAAPTAAAHIEHGAPTSLMSRTSVKPSSDAGTAPPDRVDRGYPSAQEPAEVERPWAARPPGGLAGLIDRAMPMTSGPAAVRPADGGPIGSGHLQASPTTGGSIDPLELSDALDELLAQEAERHGLDGRVL